MKAKRSAFIPEPRIITLLRSVRDQDLKRSGPHIDPKIAGVELDSVLDRWEMNENVRELRELLVGKKGGRGPRRKRSVAAREWNIANAVINAAANGERKPLKWVAEAYDLDDKQVERAWQKNRDSLLETWRQISQRSDWSDSASSIKTALAKLVEQLESPGRRRTTNRR